jgi:hypothetical protein
MLKFSDGTEDIDEIIFAPLSSYFCIPLLRFDISMLEPFPPSHNAIAAMATYKVAKERDCGVRGKKEKLCQQVYKCNR